MSLRFLAAAAAFAALLQADTALVSYENTLSPLSGALPAVGEMAPQVVVTRRDFSRITLGGPSDKVRIIATVPSVDTPVCSQQIHTFDTQVKDLSHVQMTVVSMDLPFGGQRFCRGYRIDNIDVTSDFAFHDVGKKYGTEIAGGKLQGLLARAIFVLDRDGKIVYREVVPMIEDEPNYEKVLDVVRGMK